MEYIVVIERAADGSYSAYVPDFPGCVACGDTSAEAEALIVEALHLHVEALRRHGEDRPVPDTVDRRLDREFDRGPVGIRQTVDLWCDPVTELCYVDDGSILDWW